MPPSPEPTKAPSFVGLRLNRGLKAQWISRANHSLIIPNCSG